MANPKITTEKLRDKEWLKDKYSKMTAQEIAKKYDYNISSVYRYLNKFDLIQKDQKPYKNKEWLKEQLVTKNRTTHDVAVECGINVRSLSDWIKRFNIDISFKYDKPYHHKEWLEEQLKQNNNSIVEISNLTGFKPDTLREWCHRFGLTPERRKQKLNVIEDYFENIDTPRKAYWLGLLMADGWVLKDFHDWGILLKPEDEYILKELAKDINYLGNFRYCKTGKYGLINHPNELYPQMMVPCMKMCLDLTVWGVTPQKTGKEVLPKELSKDLIPHFIRGFIDGDGWISKPKDKKIYKYGIGCCSASYNILLSIKNYLEENIEGLNNNSIHKQQKGNIPVYYLQYYGKPGLKIMDHIYKDADIYLKRKHDKYIELKELINQKESLKTEMSFEKAS